MFNTSFREFDFIFSHCDYCRALLDTRGEEWVFKWFGEHDHFFRDPTISV